MNQDKKMIMIGMDGLDPDLVQKYMDQGILPHFKKLAERGSFSRLKTSNPPQSPVAWSCLVSGSNPGQHDIFDFVIRNPATYLPDIGMTETVKTPEKSWRSLMSGLTGPQLHTRRKGKTMWDYLGEKNIPSVVLRCPVTFPAEPLTGRLLSGMGTPDIRGTQGIFTYFSTEDFSGKDIHGRVIKVRWEGTKIQTELIGPKLRTSNTTKDVSVPLQIIKMGKDKVRVTLDGATQELNVGQWSDWFRLKFKAGLMSDIYGICRLHLNSLEPEFGLYVTAVNIDPQSPAVAISYPTNYTKEIFKEIGNYYTQGMPYDTWALNENTLGEKEFLEQAYSILDENIKILDLEMKRFDKGLLFAYFGATDLIQHMFWRYLDPAHPSPHRTNDPEIKEAIKNIYIKMDTLLGDIQSKMDDETALVVLSDHGFGSFRRAVHLNSWLRDHGFLALKNEEHVGEELLLNVDWDNTRAYSVGFGGIYINQFGRERNGIVYKGAESDELKAKITQLLKKWKDTDGTSVVKNVYLAENLYHGPYESNGPDLFVGFNENYRASWQTGLGGAPEHLIEDNTRAWSGDHLCDPSFVSGVILSNQKITETTPSLMDINPTVLKYFGIHPPQNSEGKPLF